MKRDVTSTVKVVVPDNCPLAEALKVNTAELRSRVVEVATSSTSKPVAVTLVI